MNILIFDHKNQLHQFHMHKKWVNDFVFNCDFLGFDSHKRQHLIEHISQTHTVKKIISLHNSAAINNLQARDILPSTDYGIALIDCVHKNILSMNEYGVIGQIDSFHTSELLSSQDLERNKKELIALRQTKKYFHHFFAISKIISRFADNSKIKIKENVDNISITKQDVIDFTISQKLGWRIESELEYKSLELHMKIIKTIEHSGIVLKPSVLNAWNDFYNGAGYAYFNEFERDILLKNYQKFKVTQEKQKISQLIEKKPLHTPQSSFKI